MILDSGVYFLDAQKTTPKSFFRVVRAYAKCEIAVSQLVIACGTPLESDHLVCSTGTLHRDLKSMAFIRLKLFPLGRNLVRFEGGKVITTPRTLSSLNWFFNRLINLPDRKGV